MPVYALVVLLPVVLILKRFFSSSLAPFSWHRAWVLVPALCGVGCYFAYESELTRFWGVDDALLHILLQPLFSATAVPLILNAFRVRNRLLASLLVLLTVIVVTSVGLSLIEAFILLGSVARFLMILAIYGTFLGFAPTVLCATLHYSYSRRRLLIGILAGIVPLCGVVAFLLLQLQRAPVHIVLLAFLVIFLSVLPLSLLIAWNPWTRAVMTGEMFLKLERQEPESNR